MKIIIFNPCKLRTTLIKKTEGVHDTNVFTMNAFKPSNGRLMLCFDGISIKKQH